MLKEFRAFIARGNVLDLAVAVIIGAAFAKIATSLTEDIIMPVIGAIFGGLDFSSYFTLLGPVPDGYHGSLKDYAALKAAGAPVLGWGEFVTVVINFLILAFIIFLLVRCGDQADAQKRGSGRPERGRSAERNPRRASEALKPITRPRHCSRHAGALRRPRQAPRTADRRAAGRSRYPAEGSRSSSAEGGRRRR